MTSGSPPPHCKETPGCEFGSAITMVQPTSAWGSAPWAPLASSVVPGHRKKLGKHRGGGEDGFAGAIGNARPPAMGSRGSLVPLCAEQLADGALLSASL